MRRVGIAGGRGVGMAAVQRSEEAAKQTANIAAEIASDREAHIKEQVALFRKHLEEFAVKYRAEINKDPQFRHHFIRMAKSIGVDPLSSAKEGLLAQMGIGLGSFYADLAVQVAHVCMATRPMNGGLISMQDLVSRVNTMRGSRAGSVNEDDVRRSLGKLTSLAGGYNEVTVGGKRYVSSVPELLGGDTTAVLSAAGSVPGGYLTLSSLCGSTSWPTDRAQRALTRLLRDGVAWIDKATASTAAGASSSGSSRPGEDRYYFPSISLGVRFS